MRGEYSLADIKAVTEGNNNGFGDGNGAWWIILFLIFGFGRGYGGFGGFGSGGQLGDNYVLTSDMSMLSRQISDGTNMLERRTDNIINGICTLGYDNLVQSNGINSNISNLGMALQNCCCDLKAQVADNKYEMAKGFCSTNNAITLNTRDVIGAINDSYNKLHNEIVNNRIEDKNAQIQAQASEIQALRLSASQSAQNEYLLNSLRNGCPVNATLVAGNTPIPVQYIGAGCGCSNGCGCNY